MAVVTEREREREGGGGGRRGSHSPFFLWRFFTPSSSPLLFRLPLTLDKTRTKGLHDTASKNLKIYSFFECSQAGAFAYLFSRKSLLNEIAR